MEIIAPYALTVLGSAIILLLSYLIRECGKKVSKEGLEASEKLMKKEIELQIIKCKLEEGHD